MLIAAGLWLLHRCTAEQKKESGAGGAGKTTPRQDAQDRGRKNADLFPQETSPLSAKIGRKLDDALAQIGKNDSEPGQDGEATENMLRRTSQYLLGLPPREAASAILRQLESTEDAETGEV